MRMLFIALLSGLISTQTMRAQNEDSPRGNMKERFTFLQQETQLSDEEVRTFLRMEREFRQEFRQMRESMGSHWKEGDVRNMSDEALTQRLEKGLALERDMLNLREANIRQAVEKLGIRSYSLLRDASMRFRMEKGGQPNQGRGRGERY
jgi:hypothetical protein